MYGSLQATIKVQIKFVKRQNFINCAGTSIEILNTLHQCPPFVFSIPANIYFNINNYTYPPHNIKSTNTLHFVEDWNFQVNMQFNPLLIDPLQENLNLTKLDMQSLSQATVVNKTDSFILLLSATLIIVI